MSKKKSYMDKKNILSEGVLGKILYKILPKKVINFLGKNDPEIKRLEKKLEKNRDEMEKIHQKTRDYFLKKDKFDIDKFDDKGFRDEYIKCLDRTLKK